MADMILRYAEEKDIEDMTAIDELCFASPWSEDSFRTEITVNHLADYFVAEVEQRVIAYVGVWKILDEGHITNVAVHPDFRRQGIGAKLLTMLLEETEKAGITRHTLEVRPSNDAAIALYAGFGFEEAGRRKGYYEDNGEDALIMWRHSLENGDRN